MAWDGSIPRLRVGKYHQGLKFITRESDMNIEDSIATRWEKDVIISREKTLKEAVLLVGNIRDQVDVLDRVLLSISGTCISCGEKKELPPALNGRCSECEMEL